MAERLTSWAEASFLGESLQRPEDRLNAVLNIVQNGAQTLTILSMVPDPRHWETVAAVNRNMSRVAGQPVVHRKTTLQHLEQTIESIGLAARSSLVDGNWAITDFGVHSRAAMIFAWQRFMDIALDPMVVLGTVSKGEKDEQGNLRTTPPEVRFRILRALAPGTTRFIKEVSDEIQIAEPATADHIGTLALNGLVRANIYDSNSQEAITSYSISPRGLETPNWPIFISGKRRQQNNVSLSKEVRDAVNYLSSQELPITITAVKDIVSERRGRKLPNPGKIASVLFFWSQEDIGLLEKLGVRWNEKGDATITPFGGFVFRHILRPLSLWSQNEKSVGEINEIDQKLRRNPQAYKDLYQEIAQTFITNSPAKNRDIKAKIDSVRGLISQHPGEYGQADLARILGCSPSAMTKVIRKLIILDEVTLEPAERGSRLLIYPKH